MTENTEEAVATTTGWEPGGRHVRAALRGLTQTERRYVRDGYIGGGIRGSTIRSLRGKGMFCLHIDSPNGQCGLMRLTPLGVNVRDILATIRGEDR